MSLNDEHDEILAFVKSYVATRRAAATTRFSDDPVALTNQALAQAARALGLDAEAFVAGAALAMLAHGLVDGL